MLKFGALLLLLGRAIFGQTQVGAERVKPLNLMAAFIIAPETQGLLHFMIGEEGGNPDNVYAGFADRLARHE